MGMEDFDLSSDYSEYGDPCEYSAANFFFNSNDYEEEENFSDDDSVADSQSSWETIPFDNERNRVLAGNLLNEKPLPNPTGRRFSETFMIDRRLDKSRVCIFEDCIGVDYDEDPEFEWVFTDESVDIPKIKNSISALYQTLWRQLNDFCRNGLVNRCTVEDELKARKMKKSAVKKEKKKGKKKKQKSSSKDKESEVDKVNMNICLSHDIDALISSSLTENLKCMNGVIPVASAENIGLSMNNILNHHMNELSSPCILNRKKDEI